MSLIKYRFHSVVLGMDTEINVVLPECLPEVEERFQVLYLLHGAGGDCDSWLRYSSIERYAVEKGMAVVMPSAYNSCYADMVYGIQYFTFLSEELPARLERIFPISNMREKRYVAGFSMGGRGAFLWGLRKPEFFKAAICLSGSLDVAAMAKRMRLQNDNLSLKRFINAFGDPEKLDFENDIYALAKTVEEQKKLKPKFLYMCGMEDERYQEQFLPFLEYCRKIGLPIEYIQDHGKHDFTYWDSAIWQAMEWIEKLP